MDNDNDEVADSPKLASAKERYSAFLLNNVPSEILAVTTEGDEHLFVTRPWSDGSLALAIEEEDGALVEALNNIYLPPRYTAIYHRDLRQLEVIWTAYKLDNDQKDLEGRKFSLNLPNVVYDCEFTNSSARLLQLAKASVPVEISGNYPLASG